MSERKEHRSHPYSNKGQHRPGPFDEQTVKDVTKVSPGANLAMGANEASVHCVWICFFCDLPIEGDVEAIVRSIGPGGTRAYERSTDYGTSRKHRVSQHLNPSDRPYAYHPNCWETCRNNIGTAKRTLMCSPNGESPTLAVRPAKFCEQMAGSIRPTPQDAAIIVASRCPCARCSAPLHG